MLVTLSLSSRRSAAQRLVVLGLALVLSLVVVTAARAATSGDLTFQQCLSETATSGCTTTANGLGGGHGLVVSPDGTDVYVVGKPSDTTEGQVAEFRRSTTGALTKIGCIGEGAEATNDHCVTANGMVGAAGLAISPDGRNVYAVSDTGNAVVTLGRNTTTGALTYGSCIAESTSDRCGAGLGAGVNGLNGATGVAVSPDGKSVYVTSETSSAVAVFNRNTTSGTLSETACYAEAGSSENCTPETAGLDHAENPVVSPDGKNVYVTGYLGNDVAQFSRSATGALAFNGCVGESGSGCATRGYGLNGADGIAISPNGGSLYVASEKSNALVTLTRSLSGALSEAECWAASTGDSICHAAPGLTGAARVAVSPDGENVYVTGYTTSSALDVFPRSGSGALGTVQQSLTSEPGFNHIAALEVSPDGGNVYTGAATSNAIDSFSRSAPPVSTSAPTITGTAKQGQTLTEHHGQYLNVPTGYAYQWARCGAGSCTSISGATGQTHTLTSLDVGHTIVVRELARNGAGSAPAAASAPTAKVQPLSSTGRVALGRSSTSGDRVSVPVNCGGLWGQICHVSLKLTVVETIRAGRVRAVRALAVVQSSRRARTTHRTKTLGSRSLSLQAGHKSTVRITLSAAGRRLLKPRRKLKVRVTVLQSHGSVTAKLATRTVTFKHSRKKRRR
jgi:DNA-binding beta-propeller fold protein YncE